MRQKPTINIGRCVSIWIAYKWFTERKSLVSYVKVKWPYRPFQIYNHIYYICVMYIKLYNKSLYSKTIQVTDIV